LDVKTVPAA